MVCGVSWLSGGLRSQIAHTHHYTSARTTARHKCEAVQQSLDCTLNSHHLAHRCDAGDPGRLAMGRCRYLHGQRHVHSARGNLRGVQRSDALPISDVISGDESEPARPVGLRAISSTAADAAEAAEHRENHIGAARHGLPRDTAQSIKGYFEKPEDAAKGEACLQRAGQMLRMVHKMAPANPDDFNRALIIWRAIRDVPEGLRHRLLDLISARDINRLWETAQKRYEASGATASAALGAEYSQWDDFPMDPGEVVVFEGKAAGPLPWLSGLLGLDRFRKLFFLHPDSEELLGRLDVGYGALGAKLYPTYFRATIGSSIVSATKELADVQLDYAVPSSLSLSKEDLPDASWPRPKVPRWPFDRQLSDYMRAVGPGVYVGRGWHGAQSEDRPSRQFLSFMLVRLPGLADCSTRDD